LNSHEVTNDTNVASLAQKREHSPSTGGSKLTTLSCARFFDDTGKPVQIGIYSGAWVWIYNGKRVSSVQAVIRPKEAID
jgi:hypothetical protein